MCVDMLWELEIYCIGNGRYGGEQRTVDPLPVKLGRFHRLVQKMAAEQPPLALDQSRVGSDDYLSSLTRRLDILEKKLVGNSGIKEDQPPLKTTVNVSFLPLAASGLTDML